MNRKTPLKTIKIGRYYVKTTSKKTVVMKARSKRKTTRRPPNFNRFEEDQELQYHL